MPKLHFERSLFLGKVIGYPCRENVIEEVYLTSVSGVNCLKNGIIKNHDIG